jgi:uncharacterized repeat protein (TIGR01451 family)
VKRDTRVGVAGLLVLVCSAATHAQGYEVSWWTVDGGGTTVGIVGGTYNVASTVGQPDAGGPHAGGTYALHGGFWAIQAGGIVVQQANLGITKTNGVSAVSPGQPVTYQIAASNAGPSPVTGATVSDTPPAALTGVTWTCFAVAGSSCPPSGSGPIAASVNLAVNGVATFTMTATVSPTATGSIANTAAIAAPSGVTDPNLGDNVATDTDLVLGVARVEIAHGTRLRGTLAAVAAIPDADAYRIRQQPWSSYEVVVDETSGDIGNGAGPLLERLGPDGTTVIQTAVPVGSGPSRSLRFVNATSSPIDDQRVRVRSASCSSNCGVDDVYRLRAWETTASVPRFNNAGTQVTVLLLQNPTNAPVSGTVYAWTAAGSLTGQHGFTLTPHALLVLNLGPLAPGIGGTLTIAHDGPYGGLAGKTVALEPATGFSFDSPLVWRSR